MREIEELASTLVEIDGRGYRSYKQLEGAWRFSDFELHLDHVQGDPFADPTRMRVSLLPEIAALPERSYRNPSRALGTSAFLARMFSEAARSVSRPRGSGKSGEIRMEHPGQKVMPQTAVSVARDGGLEARFTAGLPAEGRRVAGRAATVMLLTEVPRLVRTRLIASVHDPEELERSAATNEDADVLRGKLERQGLVAFVADGARLPRRSGIDDLPLEGEAVVPFTSPDSLAVELRVPNSGTIRGMGLESGITLIVGGGFHGKSTLLRALEAGVYNHRPTDGRERVVSRSDAVKIRAEDGRSVAGVDISGFIDGLPFGRDTHRFSTANASGSTSQAAAIVESLEAGTRLLLVDEDTSATNFMIRDQRMQDLVPTEAEPITPFVDRVRDLHEEAGVSCVIVIGGSGDYLDAADRVLRMRDYRAEDVTVEAAAVAAAHPTGRRRERTPSLRPGPPRRVDPASVDPRRGRRATYVRVPDDRTIIFGTEAVDLVAVEQLANRAQTRAVGRALAYLSERVLAATPSIPAALDEVERVLLRQGLDAFDTRLVGDLAAFRRFEVAAALNRMRSLRII